MTAEKYVNQIVKKVHCDKSRKNDIKKQLLSEINERMSNGESIEDIIKAMGKVSEIADNFNESISDADKKKYKQKKILKISACAIIVLLMACVGLKWVIPTVGDLDESRFFSKSEVEKTLIEVIDLLDNGDYEALQSMSTEQMAVAFNEESMEAAKANICDDFGGRVSVGNIYSGEVIQQNLHYATCQVNVSYDNAGVTYTITFDENMKIAGLYMK